MYKDKITSAIIALMFLLTLVVGASSVFALSKESSSAPGEAMSSDADETTAVQMAGVFAVEMNSTGLGTIDLKRSEDGTNYYTVKTYTKSSTKDLRKYFYETFGDLDSGSGAYYKLVLDGDLSSGSLRGRLVQ